MQKIGFEQQVGVDERHLIEFFDPATERVMRLTPATAAAFEALAGAAARAGFQLGIASGFRDFDRQRLIWNEKALGRRPVLCGQGRPLDVATLSDRERVFAILRWSALPGASRHHWGTDLDLYDVGAMPEGYQLQLSAAECGVGGVFHAMHCWLGEMIAAGTAFDFYRPYACDWGGVAPEPWHISFSPESDGLELTLEPQRLRDFIETQNLVLGQVVLDHFEEIFERFIRPARNTAPMPGGHII